MADALPHKEPTDRYLRMREQVLVQAASVFNTKGLRGATMADVAERLGVSANSLSYYYRRKEDLAADCFIRTLDTLDDLVTRALEQNGVTERIRHLLRAWLALLADIATGERGELVTFYDLRSLPRTRSNAAYDRFIAFVRKGRSLVTDDTLTMTRQERNARAHLVFSVIFSVRNLVDRYEVEDYARAADRMADILTRGLNTTPATALPAGEVHAPASRNKNELQREAILHAATDLINQEGYRGASVDKIAAKMGLTKGSFYHHMDAKDELVTACFERSHQVIRVAQHQSMGAGANGRDSLMLATASLVRYQLSPAGPLLRYTALAAAPEDVRPGLLRVGGRLTGRFAAMVSDGVADGSVRAVDAAIAAHVVDTAINATVELQGWTEGLSGEPLVEAYLRPLFDGLLRSPVPVLHSAPALFES